MFSAHCSGKPFQRTGPATNKAVVTKHEKGLRKKGAILEEQLVCGNILGVHFDKYISLTS